MQLESSPRPRVFHGWWVVLVAFLAMFAATLTGGSGFSVFVSNNGTNGKVTGNIASASQAGLSLTGHVLTSQATAQSAVAAVASAVTLLGSAQSTVGVLQNRLSFAMYASKPMTGVTPAALHAA